MDTNLLIVSIVGLVISVVCLVVGTWLFRKAPQISKLIEKLPTIKNEVTEEVKPEPSLLEIDKKLKKFEENTA